MPAPVDPSGAVPRSILTERAANMLEVNVAEFSKVLGKDAMRPEHVSLFLLPIDGKPCGNVHAPLLLAGNIVSGEEVMESLPAAEAVRVAKRLADEAGTNVDVSDPEGLWRTEWGPLH